MLAGFWVFIYVKNSFRDNNVPFDGLDLSPIDCIDTLIHLASTAVDDYAFVFWANDLFHCLKHVDFNDLTSRQKREVKRLERVFVGFRE